MGMVVVVVVAASDGNSDKCDGRSWKWASEGVGGRGRSSSGGSEGGGAVAKEEEEVHVIGVDSYNGGGDKGERKTKV